MLGGELGVEQRVAADLQPRDQMDQRDLRGVALPREHAFAEEGGAEADAVEAADQLSVAPGLDGVAGADVEQLAVEPADALVDPGLRPRRGGVGAAVDDRLEIGVDADLELARGDRARQPAGQVEACRAG